MRKKTGATVPHALPVPNKVITSTTASTSTTGTLTDYYEYNYYDSDYAVLTDSSGSPLPPGKARRPVSWPDPNKAAKRRCRCGFCRICWTQVKL